MNINSEYKNTLLNFDLKSFLKTHTQKDILSLRSKYPVIYRLLSQQVTIYPKAAKKLPSFIANFCWLTSKSYEQASSEILAEYKAGLFSGNTIIDLSAGLGADDAAFSRTFKNVISVDNDEELNFLAALNFKKLGIDNIERINSDALDFIRRNIKADLVYIDADRRTGRHADSKKSLLLQNSSPPVIEMLPRLFTISGNILLKLSPLADITYIKKTLIGIKKITVVSLDNEVKEILVHLNPAGNENILISAVDIKSNGEIKTFSRPAGNTCSVNYGSGGKYFYVPSPAIIKSGLTAHYAEYSGLYMIGKNSPYLTGLKLINEFSGKTFLILNSFNFSKSAFKNYLKTGNIRSASVAVKNFPLTPDEIKRQFKIKDGGDDYLFFTADNNRKRMVYHCRRYEK